MGERGITPARGFESCPINVTNEPRLRITPARGFESVTIKTFAQLQLRITPARGFESLSKSGITRVRGFLDISYL